MGIFREIQRLFEKTESLELKKTHKDIYARFKQIENIKDPKDRLEPFKELKAEVDKIFKLNADEAKTNVIEQASAKPDKDIDGWRRVLSPTPLAIGFLGFVNAISGTSVPIMASFLPLFLTGGASVVILGGMAAGHFLIKRHRAHHLGLTPSDVKHAKKLRHTQGKLESRINKIDAMDDIKKHLEAVSAKYNAASSKPGKNAAKHAMPTPLRQKILKHAKPGRHLQSA